MVSRRMFSVLESVAFDTGYAGSSGIQPQSWVNGNGTSYIYFGSGEFDGQGSGHDYYGTVSNSASGFFSHLTTARSSTCPPPATSTTAMVAAPTPTATTASSHTSFTRSSTVSIEYSSCSCSTGRSGLARDLRQADDEAEVVVCLQILQPRTMIFPAEAAEEDA
eukprot:763538-Hanusia_phi.AAC.3